MRRTGIPIFDAGKTTSTTMQFLVLVLFAVVVSGKDNSTGTDASTPQVTEPRGQVDEASSFEKADNDALLAALKEAGGPGGTLEDINAEGHGNSTVYRDHSNCSFWDYDNTTVYPNGRFRHELAVLHTENEPHEVRFAGFLGDRYAPKPFVITYIGGYNSDQMLSRPEDSCELLPWGVLQCNTCVQTHFVFHDQPEIGCRDVPQEVLKPTILPNGDVLEDKVGVPAKPVEAQKGHEELASLNVLALLQHFGGAPGKVTTNRVKPSNNSGDADTRDQWVYDYRFTNASSAVRFEHALIRSPGTPEEHEEIFGSIYWRSYSGGIFINYTKNSTGLHAESLWAKIRIYRSFWMVETPPNRFCKLVVRPGVVTELLGQKK